MGIAARNFLHLYFDEVRRSRIRLELKRAGSESTELRIVKKHREKPLPFRVIFLHPFQGFRYSTRRIYRPGTLYQNYLNRGACWIIRYPSAYIIYSTAASVAPSGRNFVQDLLQPFHCITRITEVRQKMRRITCAPLKTI